VVNDSYNVPQCSATTLDVLANDSDPDGDAITITSVSGQAVQMGWVTIQNNKIAWGPAMAAVGSFWTTSYTVTDTHGASSTGTFTVTITAGTC
jgi:hypothetical protein